MRFWGAVVFSLCLGGCTVGPNYSPPVPPVGSHFVDSQAQAMPQADPDPQWWDQFHDKTLSQLVQLAIAGNPGLQEAVLRVVEAHQNEISAGAAGLPTLSGNASYMREQLGGKGILESDGAYSGLDSLADANSPINQFSPGLGSKIGSEGTGLIDKLTQPINLYQYGLSSSWELDLFGKVRRSAEEAHADTQAQVAAANDSLIMLEAQVAQTYLQLREAQQLLVEEQKDVASAQESLTLTQNRQSLGLTTDLDVEQARTQVLSYKAQLPGYAKQAQQAINQLDVLTGQAPGALDAQLATPAPLPAVPAVIGIGVPSTLARRRPDIQEAEAQLHAQTAAVGVAVASFYPDISLTGSVGLRAVDSSYLTNWASLFYSAGPSISLPIFQGGQLTANLRTSRAEEAGAALNYRNTVLTALREVEDGLVSYRTDQQTAAATAETVQAADQSLYLADNQYANGLTNFISVLNDEESATSARQQLVQANSNLANDVVTLYTALGGGWEQSASDIPTPPLNPAPPPLPAAVDSLAAGPTPGLEK